MKLSNVCIYKNYGLHTLQWKSQFHSSDPANMLVTWWTLCTEKQDDDVSIILKNPYLPPRPKEVLKEQGSKLPAALPYVPKNPNSHCWLRLKVKSTKVNWALGARRRTSNLSLPSMILNKEKEFQGNKVHVALFMPDTVNTGAGQHSLEGKTCKGPWEDGRSNDAPNEVRWQGVWASD